LPHAAAKATEAAAPEATEAATATAASTRCMAGTPTYGYACGKLAQRVPEGEPMLDVRRREFITLLGGAAVAWPLAARAQQAAMPVIGFLHSASPDGNADRVRAFREGLKESGFVEGENVAVEYRWADNQVGRLPALAAELARRPVVAIAAIGPPAAFAAKAATPTIPIVFLVPEDPVRLGLVTSLARPGASLTGVNWFPAEVAAKRLELLRELVPGVTRVGVLIDPATTTTNESTLRDVEAATRAKGMQTQALNAGSSREIDEVFASIVRARPDALLVATSAFFADRRVQLALQAMRHAIPVTYPFREFSEAGGLMSYGASLRDALRQVGAYTGRILKGAKAADLPVAQSTKFELVINHQTARILGLAVPASLLSVADEVIE
jgi:putative ABC transport system substrate-binding protein